MFQILSRLKEIRLKFLAVSGSLVFEARMGAPSKTPTGVIKGRPVPNPEFEMRRQKKSSKLRPVHTVLEIHEKEEFERIRAAPKETLLDPPQQNLMYDYRVHRGSPHVHNRVSFYLPSASSIGYSCRNSSTDHE